MITWCITCGRRSDSSSNRTTLIQTSRTRLDLLGRLRDKRGCIGIKLHSRYNSPKQRWWRRWRNNARPQLRCLHRSHGTWGRKCSKKCNPYPRKLTPTMLINLLQLSDHSLNAATFSPQALLPSLDCSHIRGNARHAATI